MAEKVLMIALSPTMDMGTLVKWRKKEGDTVKSGDVLCEVETDKATMDYESSSEGVLLKVLLPEGGQARVGATIAILGKPGEDITGLLAEAAAAVGENQPAARPVATQTSPPSVSSTTGGAISAAPLQTGLTGAAAAGPTASPAPAGRAKSSPLARRLAEERGIDLGSVPGSGPGGRVVKRDILTAGAGAVGGTAAAGRTIASSAADQVVPLSNMRRTIARRLSESMFTAPHIYLTISIEMEALLAARAEMNTGRERKVSLNAFLIKLAAEALKRHPRVNSSWNVDSILQRGSIDIDLAVALPDGLITPVIRDCGSKGILRIEEELLDLVARARSGKLKPEEYTGAGFSISNLGSFGIEEFTAVINTPASAILAVGAIRKVPVVEEGGAGGDYGARDTERVTVKRVMSVTLSCDHRVIDGAMGAVFLADLRAMMENPFRTLL
jgi:pyruvate dehydrogenase E2 component (dihydrolipoamide acetyltransferase)